MERTAAISTVPSFVSESYEKPWQLTELEGTLEDSKSP